jgi:hypothetical protein
VTISANTTIPCVWRRFRLRLPADWELLQYSRNPAQGRCAFADRCQFRLEFSWRQVPAAPDFERMLAAYSDKLREAGDEPRRFTAGRWHGLEARTDGVRTTRFGSYFGREACLVEIVFPWPDRRDEALEQTILQTVDEEPARPDGLQHWQSFGLDLLASDGFSLTACRVEPAAARLTFQPERARSGGPAETFLRLGLVPEWLKGGVADWLRLQMGRDFAVRSESECAQAGHGIALATATRRLPGLDRLLGRRIVRHAAAWICPSDGRLYAVLCDGDPALPLAGGRLRCCPDMGGMPLAPSESIR